MHNAHVPVILCSILLLLFNYSCCCLIFCSSFVHSILLRFIVHCSWEKIVFQVFRSYCTWITCHHHHLCKSINIIHQTAPSLSYYRDEWPITIIDIAGYTEPIFSKLWSKQRVRNLLKFSTENFKVILPLIKNLEDKCSQNGLKKNTSFINVTLILICHPFPPKQSNLYFPIKYQNCNLLYYSTLCILLIGLGRGVQI